MLPAYHGIPAHCLAAFCGQVQEGEAQISSQKRELDAGNRKLQELLRSEAEAQECLACSKAKLSHSETEVSKGPVETK